MMERHRLGLILGGASGLRSTGSGSRTIPYQYLFNTIPHVCVKNKNKNKNKDSDSD